MDQTLRLFQQNSEKTDSHGCNFFCGVGSAVRLAPHRMFDCFCLHNTGTHWVGATLPTKEGYPVEKIEPGSHRKKAFSLIEVVLALGIFLITVLTLVGIMGPALKSVSTIQKSDEATSVVDSVNTFLNTSPFIGSPAADGNPRRPRFDSIYSAIQNDGHATLFVYRWYDVTGEIIIRQEIGFENNQDGAVNARSVVNANARGDGVPVASFANATSLIYRVVLTASSAMRVDNFVNEGTKGTYPRYTLTNTIGNYDGNYLALEVRIFAEDPVANPPLTDMATLADEVPILVYDTAILRN